MNWTKAAHIIGIEQSNGGQIVKEVAQTHGCNIAILEQSKSDSTPRSRRAKSRLTGGEISMPTLPTTDVITTEKKRLIESGALTIGEPCIPHTVTKSVVNNEGNIEIKEIEITGRKIPLTELRQRLLTRHEEYMRLLSLDDIKKLTKEEILTFMKKVHHPQQESTPLETLYEEFQKIQRTRTLAIWHDHSTVLHTGYILFAVWVIYDEAIFLTEMEYKAKTGKTACNLQNMIEEPEVYMIAPSSSSPSDQLALISDRLECLKEPSKAANNEEVYDQLRFFCGDKPAIQFERGTQIGGIYKCGGCGCKDQMMQDLSHALRRKLRSLSNLQNIVTKGKYGTKAGELKPSPTKQSASMIHSYGLTQ